MQGGLFVSFHGGKFYAGIKEPAERRVAFVFDN